jgi:hypothetical protein
LEVSGVYLTASASPNTAAPMARQTSTSRPDQLPASSGLEKPARPVLTPHWTKPLSLTASKIAPAWAVPDDAATASADAATKVVAKRMNGPP